MDVIAVAVLVHVLRAVLIPRAGREVAMTVVVNVTGLLLALAGGPVAHRFRGAPRA